MCAREVARIMKSDYGCVFNYCLMQYQYAGNEETIRFIIFGILYLKTLSKQELPVVTKH